MEKKQHSRERSYDSSTGNGSQGLRHLLRESDKKVFDESMRKIRKSFVPKSD